MIDAVLRFKIVGIGRRPMLIQCRTDLLISHSRILLLLLLIVHREPRFDKKLSALAESECTTRQVALFLRSLQSLDRIEASNCRLVGLPDRYWARTLSLVGIDSARIPSLPKSLFTN